MTNLWLRTQEHELNFWRTWLPANRPTYATAFRRYDAFRPFIQQAGFNGDCLDVGCGPFPFSVQFPYRTRYLIDPLIFEYADIPGNTIGEPNNASYTTLGAWNGPFLAAFVLNCLDHMPPEHRTDVLIGLWWCQPQQIYIAVNQRRPDQLEDTHPFPFTEEDLESLMQSFTNYKLIYKGIGPSDDTCRGEDLPAIQRVYQRV